MKQSTLLSFLAVSLILVSCGKEPAPSKTTASKIEQGFITPPDEAKPRVWWHWLNANITEEGIKADLDWMNRVGIGGFHNFDANQNSPQIVKTRLVYMTPEWKDTYRRMTRMADSLGFEMAIAASPGWSETGGPWVSDEHAMKKLVWSETPVAGGTAFKGKLPQPPSVAGVFQNFMTSEGRQSDFYRDVAVLAIKLPDTDKTLSELSPTMTTSGGNLTLDMLSDGDLASTGKLSVGKDGKAWIQYEFPTPVTFYSVSEAGGASMAAFGSEASADYADLEYGDDGVDFKKITAIHSTSKVNAGVFTFAPVTGKFFRLSFYPTQSPYAAMTQGMDLTEDMIALAAMFGIDIFGGTRDIDVAEFNLMTTPRVNRFIEKAGFCAANDLYDGDTPPSDKSLAVDGDLIVDLTDKMGPDGSIEWTPADGKWKILRFGYSLTGKQNAPASPEATGLEVDKFNPDYVREYLETYLDMYEDATGGLMGDKGLTHIVTDSWEAGCQNWSDDMRTYFKDLRGYDLLRYLPTVAGYIVDDAETSDKFLWDFRKTIGQLIATNHYDVISDVLARRGLKRYTESHESQRAFPGDGMEPKRNADIPMAATWTPTDGTLTGTNKEYEADVRESASVAHIYGQKYVAAESLTAMGMTGSAWSWSPETLKPTADLELSSGLNRFVLHSTVHQPDDDHMPGLSLGIFGHWFNRHETWAELAGPWMTYLARCSFMMQQGKPVEDILYFYGEDNSLTTLFKNGQPPMPKGYSYDFVNADALENVIGFSGGKITTPAGTTYSLLVLGDNASRMTMKTLKKIEQLVRKGMTVLGDKPLMTPTLEDDDEQFKALADLLWDGAASGHKVGKGMVYSGKDISEVLSLCGDQMDVIFNGASDKSDMKFVHRISDGVHIYWVDSRNYGAEDVVISFKVTGLEPELWDPVTGTISGVSYTTENGYTKVPVHFNEFDSYYVVFRKKAKDSSLTLPSAVTESVSEIEGSWEVAFDGLGCDKTVVFPDLSAWNENADESIRYYSGTAIYKKSFSAEDPADGVRMWLDLGNVKNIAEVTLNGKNLGVVWRAPFRVDITDAVKAGQNELEVKITNTWVNRLIGDKQPGATQYTWTAMPFYQAFSPLVPSGLIGPVSVQKVKR